CRTTVGVAGAEVGKSEVGKHRGVQPQDIHRSELLLAMYNAMQPGVFAPSRWDLGGALTLPGDSVSSLIAEGDTRWINRGAYDLLGNHAGVTTSSSGLPRAQALYGPLLEVRSEEHTSELQSLTNLLCRLLLQKTTTPTTTPHH